MSLEGGDGKEVCREECSLAGVQMRVAGGDRLLWFRPNGVR